METTSIIKDVALNELAYILREWRQEQGLTLNMLAEALKEGLGDEVTRLKELL